MLTKVIKYLLPVIILMAFSATDAANTAKTPLAGKMEIRASWIIKKKISSLGAIKKNNCVYVSLKALSNFLGCEYKCDLAKGKGTLSFANGILGFNQFSPYLTIGDKTYNIRHDIAFYRGEFYAPASEFAGILRKLVPEEISYSENELVLNIYPSKYNVIDLTSQQKMNGLLIEVLLSKELKYDIVKSSDFWMVITIYDGKIDTNYFNNKKPSIGILETKAYQFENSAQLSLRLRPHDYSCAHKFKDDPLRIQIAVKGEGFADTVLSYSPPDSGVASISTRDTAIDVIVIDPGHGGEDNGAIGTSKIMEKDIVLEISKKLRDLLIDEGIKVILTRDDDRFVPLGDRTRIANEAKADMFLSIHCNAAPNNKARGAMTFFLADAKTDQARAAAALENSAIKFEAQASPNGSVDDVDFIISDMVQNEYLKESADLAEMIENGIVTQAKIESRGIDQAGFFVLNKAYMPAVLIETAFITNKKDETLLKDNKTQDSIAIAIKNSVLQFKQKYEAMK